MYTETGVYPTGVYPETFERDTANRYVEWPLPVFMLIGARFRSARLKAGLSQRDLAAMSGVSQSVISRFERGLVTGMTVVRLLKIVFALGPWFPFGHCPHAHRCEWPFDPEWPATPRTYDPVVLRQRFR